MYSTYSHLASVIYRTEMYILYIHLHPIVFDFDTCTYIPLFLITITASSFTKLHGQETAKGRCTIFESSCHLPPVHHTRWRLHTFPFMLTVKQGSCETYQFFSLTRPEMEPGFTVSVAGLSTSNRPRIG